MNLDFFDFIIFIAGIVIGYAGGRYFIKPQKQEIKPDDATAISLKQNIEQQQITIDRFFEEADDVLSHTERAVQRLRQQISDGASTLSSISVAPSEKKAIIEDNIGNNITADAVPPRDYALKADSEDMGTLSEGFGLPQNNPQDKKETSPP